MPPPSRTFALSLLPLVQGDVALREIVAYTELASGRVLGVESFSAAAIMLKIQLPANRLATLVSKLQYSMIVEDKTEECLSTVGLEKDACVAGTLTLQLLAI